MHECVRRFAQQVAVPAEDRCVNEGAEGCTVVAGETGWCPACWAGVVGVQ